MKHVTIRIFSAATVVKDDLKYAFLSICPGAVIFVKPWFGLCHILGGGGVSLSGVSNGASEQKLIVLAPPPPLS